MTTTDIENSMDVDNRLSLEDTNDVDVKASTTTTKDSAVVYSPQLLQMYYKRLFPFELLFEWLNYHGTGQFSHREFSFTIEPKAGQEVYLRYQSFSSASDLQTMVCKRRPTKMDLGAVFSHIPKDHKTLGKSKLTPLEREFVIDIDLTDYDDIRNCGCTGAKICQVCWKFMKHAVNVLDQALRQDFGYRHIAWVYSGRRGVHAWVCDKAARELTDAGRSAVANYLLVNLGSDKNKDVYLPHPLHPMLARAVEQLEPRFVEDVLPATGHGLLASAEGWETLLQTLPDAAEPVRQKLMQLWSKHPTDNSPAGKWEELKTHLKIFIKGTNNASKLAKNMSSKDRIKIETWPSQTILTYTYPRLDVNVSKMRNHLLKSPFCVHPKTGRVCVPFLAKHVEDFDPFSVPTLPQLMNELDSYDQEHGDDDEEKNKVLPEWKKTSLKGYLEPFEKEFLEPMMKELRREERNAKEEQEAMSGSF